MGQNLSEEVWRSLGSWQNINKTKRNDNGFHDGDIQYWHWIDWPIQTRSKHTLIQGIVVNLTIIWIFGISIWTTRDQKYKRVDHGLIDYSTRNLVFHFTVRVIIRRGGRRGCGWSAAATATGFWCCINVFDMHWYWSCYNKNAKGKKW